MIAVIAILVTLMTAAVSLTNGTGVQSRKTGTDMLIGLIEQTRTRAITSRSMVVLAIAEPADFSAGDKICRLGIFRVSGNWNPDDITGALLSRWQSLSTGVVLIGESVGKPLNSPDVPQVPNLLDQPKVTIRYGGAKNFSVQVHVIAFNSRGGLQYPDGSSPVGIRIAEGSYRGDSVKATANMRSDKQTIGEARLKIGRVTGRPYRTDA